MNTSDAIGYLARAEGRRIRPVRFEKGEGEEDQQCTPQVPWMSMDTDAMGRVRITGHGHAGHDNEPRMQFMTDWLTQRVIPLVDPAVRPLLRGRWNVELHDSYSYLPNAAAYRNCMSFARPAHADASQSVAMIPDPYQIMDFGGIVGAAAQDSIPWAAKEPVLFFAGSTTGNRYPPLNARVQACIWSLDKPHDARFYITNVAQMSRIDLFSHLPRARQCISSPVSIPEHHKYRYQVNIVGNTACWSRVPMIMASQSLMVHLRHRDAMWYYPLLRDGTHFVGVDSLDDMLPLKRSLEADPVRCTSIVRAANAFVQDTMMPHHADAYMAQLLEFSASHGAP